MVGFLALVLTGCRTVESSLNYTEGTRALEAGDKEGAILHLEKAVRLDPTLARNHVNLAAAYFESGRMQEGWPHVRKAVILEPRNEAAQNNFRRYFKHFIDTGLIKMGDSVADVEKTLGEPDSTTRRGEQDLWQYGMVAVYFKDRRVSGYQNMDLR